MDRELLHLIKYGSQSDVDKYLKEKENPLSDNFVEFMDGIISDNKIKRSQIAQRAGLSRDYTYKLLQGTKKTTERDYIIAICMAMKMNLSKVQHALEVYPFPVLNDENIRDYTIISAINEKCSLDDLNEWLDKVHQPLLKTSPDMPSAEVRPIRSTKKTGSMSEYITESDDSERSTVMKELNCTVDARRCGPAPIDYEILGEIAVEIGENIYYVSTVFSPFMDDLFAVSSKSVFDEDEFFDESDFIEEYHSLTEAGKSDFFEFFMKLDKLTDEKAAEVRKNNNDSKKHEGVRFCQMINYKNGKPVFHAEFFNHFYPEHVEYFQIIKNGDDYKYSLSHESAFMYNEYGPDGLYEAFTGNAEPPKFFMETDNLESMKEDNYFYFTIFTQLRVFINRYAQRFGDTVKPEDVEMPDFCQV